MDAREGSSQPMILPEVLTTLSSLFFHFFHREVVLPYHTHTHTQGKSQNIFFHRIVEPNQSLSAQTKFLELTEEERSLLCFLHSHIYISIPA